MFMNVFIIVPVYNEAKVIDALSNLKKFPEYKVVIVDDASSDRPAFENLNMPFTLIRHSINLGQGAALQTGMQYALSKNAAIIVHFDADGQHDFNDINKIIDPIKYGLSDVVIGSRFLKNKKVISTLKIPLMKIIVLQIARFVQFVFTGIILSDSQNGFRAFSNKAGLLIKITENRMAHAIEIIQLIKRKNLRVKEVSIVISYSDYSIQKGQKAINGIFIIFCLIRKAIYEHKILLTTTLFIASFFTITGMLYNIGFVCITLFAFFLSLLWFLVFSLAKINRCKKITKTNKIRSEAIKNLKSFKNY